MVRNLPEGSRFNAVMSVDFPDHDEDTNEPKTAEQIERETRAEAIADARAWTLPHRLQAMEINAVNMSTVATGHWGPDGPPDFPTIGPAHWQQPTAASKKEAEYTDNFDFFRKMGWPSG